MKGESKMSIELMKFAEEQKAEGQYQILNLINKLISTGRTNDVERISRDPIYCNQLMAEFGI